MNVQKIVGGTTLAFLLMAGAAAAQTTTDYTSSTTDMTGTGSVTDVGTPNTGAGGAAAENALVLGTAAALAIAGGAYLARSRTAL